MVVGQVPQERLVAVDSKGNVVKDNDPNRYGHQPLFFTLLKVKRENDLLGCQINFYHSLI